MAVTEEMEAAPGAQAPVAAAHDHGLVMGRYRLGRRLGAGGFGAVHEALDERLDRWVAVKVIPADGAAPERARREARAAARLDHPGIVAIFDAGEEPGARYLVSELVEGRTLAALHGAGELSDRDVLRIGLALADALGHAHERGVVHRDVKPQNVIVPDRPRSWRGAAKLTDFGVARLAGDDALTVTGDVVGTLVYMAPEQAAGKTVGPRGDLYSLALVVYECLAGSNPVRGATPALTARKVGTVLPPLAKARRDLPVDLTGAIDRALRPTPVERGTLEDLADALADALPLVADEGGTVARHPLEGTSLPGIPVRGVAAVGAGALAFAALAGLSPDPALPPLVAALAATALVVALPRAGWLLTAAAVLLLLAAGGGRSVPGSAVLVFLAVAPAPLLLRSRPATWSLPALAPALGLLGLAGAYPALAGRTGRVATRAAAGALGAWWLLMAEPLLGRTLVFGPAPDVPARADFETGVSLAADVLAPTVASGLPLLLAVWAFAAVILPWLVRGWSLSADIVAASAWAAGLAAATAGLAPWLSEDVASSQPRGLVIGAALAGVLAVAGARTPERRYFPDADGDTDADE